MVKDGVVTHEKSLNLRFTYDERIEDAMNAYQGILGLIRVLEDPETYLSSLKGRKKDAPSFEELAAKLP